MSTTETGADIILQDELLRNERIFEHPTFGTLKLQRPTPRQERDIAEARRRQYHKDLKDESIMSRSELEREAIRRGIWSPEKAERLENLDLRAGQIMGLLNNVGYETVDRVLDRYNAAVTRLRDLFQDHEDETSINEAITRYFHLDLVPKQEDYLLIFRNATTTDVDDAMTESKLFRTQIELLTELANTRREVSPLRMEHVRLFMDSVESRMDRVERLAKAFYCSSKLDGSPVWASFDAMWDAETSDLDLLMEEMYCFEHGILEEHRNILGRHGFTVRAPLNPTDDSSGDSLGDPTSNSGGESQPNEPTSSGEDTA